MNNDIDKIDKLKNSKWFNIGLALLFAIFMCLLAHSEANPTITKTLEIPISFTNISSDPKIELVFRNENRHTVTITIKGSQNTINNTTAKDFVCEINLSSDSPNYDKNTKTFVIPAPKTNKLGVSVVDYSSISFTVDD